VAGRFGSNYIRNHDELCIPVYARNMITQEAEGVDLWMGVNVENHDCYQEKRGSLRALSCVAKGFSPSFWMGGRHTDEEHGHHSYPKIGKGKDMGSSAV
jgi:hypothetical protein